MRFVLITVFVLILVGLVNAMFSLGPMPLALTIGIMYVAYAVYGLISKDHTIWLWLLFGFVVGLVELASNCDYHIVTDPYQALVYPKWWRMIGVTPSYLRFGWGMIFTILGLIGLWIRRRNTFVEATLLTAALGAIFILIFENLARQAGWWYYQNTPMLIWSPYFCILFEFLSTLLVVPVGWWITGSTIKKAYFWAIGLGVAMGLWMCVAMRIAFWLLGPCSGAILQFQCKPTRLPTPWGPLG